MLPTNPLLNATAPAGPHLPVALLRQYAAGTLAPAAQHRVEAHTLACPRCGDILEGLLQSPPATTDQALAQLQQRLRQRVQQQAASARLAPRQPHWLVPQLAAAAALLLGLVAGGWWTWQQRHPTPPGAPRPTPMAVQLPATAPPTTTKQLPVAPAPTGLPRASASRSAQPKLAKSVLLPATKHRPLVAHQPASRQPQPTPDLLATAPDAATASPPVAAAPLAAPPLAGGLAAPSRAAQDSGEYSRLAFKGRVATRSIAPEAARVHDTAMPAGPAIAPAPAGGYGALREKLRREAAEFVPEAPQQRLSGTVQLRLAIGPDGKIEKISIIRGLREDYDAEAQRLLCDGPAWVPGISNGRRAAQVVDVAVPF